MESWIDWLPRIGACLMLLIGLVGFFKPRMFLDTVQITLAGPMGTSEARAVFGGLNLGLAIAVFVLADPAVFTAIGIAWVMATLARFWSLAVDGISTKDFVPGLVVDATLSILFLAPLLLG